MDAQLIKSAQSPEDGNIRIHSQTYCSYHMTIAAGQSTFEYVILIKVSSLKAIYFTFSPTQYSGIEIFDQKDYCTALATKPTFDGTRVMKTTWFWNNLGNYQFFLDGKPTPASPISTRIGFSECLAELARALHFGHKSVNGNFLSLLEDNGVYPEQNFRSGARV